MSLWSLLGSSAGRGHTPERVLLLLRKLTEKACGAREPINKCLSSSAILVLIPVLVLI